MQVLYWQLAIWISILFSGLLAKSFFKDRLNFHLVAYIVAAGWLVHTQINVRFSSKLYLFQVASIVGAAFVVRRLALQAEISAKRVTDLGAAESKAHSLQERLEGLQRNGKADIVIGAQHSQELKRAFAEARTSICIFSGWVKSYVVDQAFGDILEYGLRRGVSVYIGFGYVSDSESHDDGATKEAMRLLQAVHDYAVAHSHPGKLVVSRFPNHQKLLICDESFAICGSANWLANAKFANAERSYRISDRTFVAEERGRAIDQALAGELVIGSERAAEAG